MYQDYKYKDKLLYIKNVTKIYRSKDRSIVANDNLTFEVKQGEILGILGPNGAGKTTLIKQIATLLLPDKGDIFYRGISIVRHPEAFLGRFSFLMEGSRNLYEYLTARVNIIYFALLHKISPEEAMRRKDRLFEIMGLKEFENEYVIDFSLGMKKKLAIAMCFITNPSIVFLDEPLSGLDVIASQELFRIIKDIVNEENVTFIIASHRMDFIEKITDRVLWLKEGKILKIEETNRIKTKRLDMIYEIYLRESEEVKTFLKREGVKFKNIGPNTIKCDIPFAEKRVLKNLLDFDEILNIEKKERDLETIFKEIYK